MSATMNRRSAIRGAATVGCTVSALAVGAAMGSAMPRGACAAGEADPLIGMWAERQQAKAAADAAFDEPEEDDFVDRQCDIENAILRTVPVSPEGAAIVATLLLESQNEQDAVAQRAYGRPAHRDPEADGGVSLARHILAQTPPDVLRRAGLEAVA